MHDDFEDDRNDEELEELGEMEDEDEETLEELDVDERGDVRPRRRRFAKNDEDEVEAGYCDDDRY